MIQLETLKGNLQEIYHAINTASTSQVNLVANVCGTRLYNASQGWGRLWRWFYIVTEVFLGKGLRLANVKKALMRTHLLFQKNLQEIRYHASQYQAYLKKTMQGYSTNESEFFQTRQCITRWNQTTRPFVKMAVDSRKEVINKLFKVCFKQLSITEQPFSFFSYPEFDKLGQFQKIIDLEGMTNGPLPLELFEKICKNKKLSDSDFKDLDKWIKKINTLPSSRHLHQALQGFVNTINVPQSGENFEKADLIRLELMLEERGCKLFRQDDPKHLKWRDSLKKGFKLNLNEKEIVLGDPVGKKILGIDQFLHFSINDMPHLLVITGNNESVLGMKKHKHLPENGYGVEPIQILDIFDHGRWALVEKLEPLTTHYWTSTNYSLSSQDELFLRPLLNLLKWLIQQQQTPDYFSLKYLMMNSQNQLRALRPTSKKEFNFNALEDFVLQCAAGNLKVYQHLMEKSGLYAHMTTKFYHEVMANVLKNNPTPPEDLAGIYNIEDPRIVDRANKLSQEVLLLKQKCCLKILENRPEKDPKNVEQSVDRVILKCHLTNKSSGIIWPTLFENVISEIL